MYQYLYIQYICGYEPATGQCVVIECPEPKPGASHAGNRYHCICRHLLDDDQYRGFERCPECYGNLPDNLQYTEKISERTGGTIDGEEYNEKEDIIALPDSASMTSCRATEDEWEDDISLQTSYTDLKSQTLKRLKRLQQRAEVSFPTCRSTCTEGATDVSVLDGCDDGHGNGRQSPDLDLMFELELDYPDPESTAYFSKEVSADESVCNSLECIGKPCTRSYQKLWHSSNLAYSSAYFGAALYRYRSPATSAAVLPFFIRGVQTA
jgi:hypothetical protein